MESIKEIKARSAGIRLRARSLLLFSLFTAISTGMAAKADAQTFAEWFSQKKTQKKYLLQQIAALQIYSGYLKKGYSIASNGLGNISGYLKAENRLHSTYYNRLKTADPVVKNDPMIKAIMDWQQDILKRTQEINQTNGMTPAEKGYLSKVSAAVLADCDQQLNTLQNVISDNKVEMSDAERLTLITRLHAAMLANYKFTSGFSAQVKILAVRREQEKTQLAVSKQVYGIN
jgi:Na+-translocating ferredoxin:NAD+ oxidoreductase RnfG subunit